MSVNLTAPFLLGQRFGPSMARRGCGRIINVGSQQSIRAFGNSGAYGVSKAGVIGLTRSQAEAWSKDGVCCNAIVPGFVHTPMTEPVFADPALLGVAGRPHDDGRMAFADDFRGVTIFLAGPAAGLRDRPGHLRRRRLLLDLSPQPSAGLTGREGVAPGGGASKRLGKSP